MRRFHAFRRRVSPRRGMTLLEVMVSIAVLLVMSVVIYEMLDSMIQAREVLGRSDEATRAARVTVDKLRRELELAYLTPHVDATNTFRTVFVGTDDNPDKLYFASLGHERLYRDSRECDETEITVWAEDGKDRDQGQVLYHREAPHIDEKPDEGGPIYALAYNVQTFNVRYLDGQNLTWRDDWDTRNADTAGRLPRAVQIGLVLTETHEEDGREVTDQVPFVTTVDLAYAEKISPDQLQQLPPDPNDPNANPPGGGKGPGGRGPGAGLNGAPTGLPGLGGGFPGMFGGGGPLGGGR